jgi:hypothetical protein
MAMKPMAIKRAAEKKLLQNCLTETPASVGVVL